MTIPDQTISTQMSVAATSVTASSKSSSSSDKTGAAMLALREIAGQDSELMAKMRDVSVQTQQLKYNLGHAAAELGFAAKMTEGTASIVSGTISMGGAAVSAGYTGKAALATDDLAPAVAPALEANAGQPVVELEPNQVADAAQAEIGPVAQNDGGDVANAGNEAPLQTRAEKRENFLSLADSRMKGIMGLGAATDGLGKIIGAASEAESRKTQAAAERVGGLAQNANELASQVGQSIQGALQAYQNASETQKRSAGT